MKIFHKYFLINLCFVLTAHASYSQASGKYKSDSIGMAHIPEMTLSIDANQLQKVTPAAFGFIRVEDVRFDTTQIGIYSIVRNLWGYADISNFKINLEGGLGNSFSNYLNNSFKALPGGRDKEVVCFIKSLSIIKRDTLIENQSMDKKYVKLAFEAEVFLHSGDNFYAAFKIDTTLNALIDLSKKQIKGDMQNYLLMPALQLLKDEISRSDWANIAKRKAFTQTFVYTHYFTSRFNIPVLTQPCKKGIYRSFAEFRNNAPSILDFTIEKEKFNTILIAGANGNYIPTTKLFGFCDGKGYWILRGNYRFPMFRVSNGFEFFLTTDKKIKLLLALDMENGKIY